MIWIDVDTALTLRVNAISLKDAADFVTIETAIAYNESGMALYWNFVTCDGTRTRTQITPTTAGTHDWAHEGGGFYTMEIPATDPGDADVINDTEGYGYFSGVCDNVLDWRSETFGFRAAALNDALIENAWSTTRGLAGTALPNAAADAAGGLVVSDAGGLDVDTLIKLAAAGVGAVGVVDNGATLTLTFKDTDGTTTLRTLTYTKATGARVQV